MPISLPQFKAANCHPQQKGRHCKRCRAKGERYADWREAQTGQREFPCPFEVEPTVKDSLTNHPTARIPLPFAPPTAEEVDRRAALPCKLRSAEGDCLVCGCRVKNKKCRCIAARGEACPAGKW